MMEFSPRLSCVKQREEGGEVCGACRSRRTASIRGAYGKGDEEAFSTRFFLFSFAVLPRLGPGCRKATGSQGVSPDGRELPCYATVDAELYVFIAVLHLTPTTEFALYLARGCDKNNLWDPRCHPSRLSSLRQPPQLQFNLKDSKMRMLHRTAVPLSKRGRDDAAEASPHAQPDRARSLLYHLGFHFSLSQINVL